MNTKTKSVRKKKRFSAGQRNTDYSSELPIHLPVVQGVQLIMDAANQKSRFHLELVHGGFETESLNPIDREAVYQIIQTHLAAIAKNPTSTAATVHLAKNLQNIAIVIEDNGITADPEKVKKSRSAKKIQGIAERHVGRFNLRFIQGVGTILQVLICVNS